MIDDRELISFEDKEPLISMGNIERRAWKFAGLCVLAGLMFVIGVGI